MYKQTHQRIFFFARHDGPYQLPLFFLRIFFSSTLEKWMLDSLNGSMVIDGNGSASFFLFLIEAITVG